MWKKLKVTGIQSAIGIIDTYFIVRDDIPFRNEEHFHVPASLYLLLGSANGAKLSTQKVRASDLVLFFNILEFPNNPRQPPLDWKLLTDKDRAGYLGYLSSERENSESTILRAISSIRPFYLFARDMFPILEPHKTYSFPRAKYKTRKSIITNTLTPKRVKSQYIDRLLFKVIEENITGKSKFARLRNLIGIRLGRNSGLRAHEVTRSGNFNTIELRTKIAEMRSRSESSIEIDIVSEKGDKGRPIIIKKDDVVLIERFLNGPRQKVPEGDLLCRTDGLPFSSGSTPTTKWFKDALKKAIPTLLANYYGFCSNPDRRFIIAKKSLIDLSFHSGRHSYATDLVGEAYEAGTDPKELLLIRLGHVNKSTLSVYITVEAILVDRKTSKSEYDVSALDK
ncbi:site-specific integrase [Vibrio splendidus]|uniref:site-specific integrase n=1 Tax=Vibrio splendidus TaxID=29497 RepID=UPI000D3349CD|nr:site-specific integrase [Vibrio splendidus]PTP83186.1 site-specific integrase [Vibrio splendidus]